ncbi:MAG: RNA helicase [Pseudomonadota bacterium]
MNDIVQDDGANKIKTCGLIMPISAIDGCSAEHWVEVKAIIQEALKDTEFKVDLVSNANEVGVIQQRIVTNVYTSDIVVCDVSAKNPNVMFELGMRLAFDKPTIIIKDDETNYSFDTSPIEHLEYPRDLHYHNIQRFKELLKAKVVATYKKSTDEDYVSFLKNFGAFTVAKVEAREVTKEDFIVQSIDDLRNEVGRLSLYMRHSEIRSDFDSVLRKNWSGGGSRNRISFLTNISDEDLILASDFSSKDFNELFTRYLSSVSGKRPPTPDEYDRLRSRFYDAIQEEISSRPRGGTSSSTA